MDFLRIDPESFLPSDSGPIEALTSKIWTERYFDAGEFELRSPLVEQTILSLPKGSLISLRDSDEIMMVESHEPNVTDEGKVELVVKGRALTDIFNYRWIIGPAIKSGGSWNMHGTIKHTRADKILRVMYNSVINSTYDDFTYPYDTSTAETYPRFRYIGQYTHIDNAVVTDSSTVTDTTSWAKVSRGSAMSHMQNWMKNKTLGIRTLRPRPGGSTAKVVGIGPNRGLTRTNTANIQSLRFDLYNGVDRSDEIVFSSRLGDLQGSNYLFSIKDYINMAVVSNEQEIAKSFATPPPDAGYPSSAPNGNLLRRILGIDVAAPEEAGLIRYIEDTPDEEFFPTDAQLKAYDEYTDVRHEAFQSVWKEHPFQSQWSGEISKSSQLKYGQDYFLGDTVTLQGDYGFTQKMVVIENIRTEDAEGERSYPGLVIPGAYGQ